MNSTMEMTETIKKDNQFFGDFLQKEENPKECVIMGLIRTQKETLEDLNDIFTKSLKNTLKTPPNSL